MNLATYIRFRKEIFKNKPEGTGGSSHPHDFQHME